MSHSATSSPSVPENTIPRHVPGAGPASLRLLLPVSADPDSGWGLHYALRCHAEGRAVEVCLLHVAQRITCCEIFAGAAEGGGCARSQPPIPGLADAAAMLGSAGIAVRGFLASGGVVETVLDMAESLDCHQIVLPLNDRPGVLGGFWHRNTVRFIQEAERGIPVVTVDGQGRVVTGMYARRRQAGVVA